MNIQPTASTGVSKTDDRVIATTSASASAAKPATAAGSTDKVNPAAENAEPTRTELNKAVKTLNDSMTASSQDLQFSIDEDSKKTVVKLIDRTTHEVLRQMPSKEALEIARSLDKAMGKLIDQQA